MSRPEKLPWFVSLSSPEDSFGEADKGVKESALPGLAGRGRDRRINSDWKGNG